MVIEYTGGSFGGPPVLLVEPFRVSCVYCSGR